MRKLGEHRGRLLLLFVLLSALPAIVNVLLSSRNLHAAVPRHDNNNGDSSLAYLPSLTTSTSTSMSATTRVKVKGIRVVALCACSKDSVSIEGIEKWRAIDTAVSLRSFVLLREIC